MELNICLCKFVNDFLPDTGRMFVRAGFYTLKYIEQSICLYEIVRNGYRDMLPYYSNGREIGVLEEITTKAINIGDIETVQYLKNIIDREIANLNGKDEIKEEINTKLINHALNNGKLSIARYLGFTGGLDDKGYILYGNLDWIIDQKTYLDIVNTKQRHYKYIIEKKVLNGDSEAFKGIDTSRLPGTFWSQSFESCMKGGNLELIKLYSTKINMDSISYYNDIFKYGTIESLSILLPLMKNCRIKITYPYLSNRDASIIHHTISLSKENSIKILEVMVAVGRSDIYDYYLKDFPEWNESLLRAVIMSGNVELFEKKKTMTVYPNSMAIMSGNVQMYNAVLEHNKKFPIHRMNIIPLGLWGLIKRGYVHMLRKMDISDGDLRGLMRYAEDNHHLQILQILKEETALKNS